MDSKKDECRQPRASRQTSEPSSLNVAFPTIFEIFREGPGIGPAVGALARHKREQAQLVKDAFTT